MLLDSKCNFLLVFPDEEESNSVKSEIDKHVNRTQYISASNFSTAKKAIKNNHPHIVVAKITKVDSNNYEIAEYLLAKKKFKNTAIIFVGETPEEKVFVDAVETGKIHFINDASNEDEFNHCLNNALYFVTSHDEEPVNLKFLSPGDQLISFGDTAKFVYVVKTGSLEASYHKNGEKVILGSIEAGEFVGEMAYISGESRSADVFAVTDCELIEIPISVIGEVLSKRPSWTKALMRTLSQRMKRANQLRS